MNRVILLFLLLFLFGCQNSKEKTLTIAVASNMQFAMEELEMAFEKSSEINCDIVYSSSGKLTTQILEGAPFDVFVSADTRFVQEIHSKGFTSEAPKIYAYGKLVLMSGNPAIELSLDNLEKVEHIALPNPKTAPYGIAAQEVMEQLQLMNNSDKFVFGESISQVNQFIVSGAAEVGFTSLSTALSNKMTGNFIEVPKDAYTPIAQAAIPLNNKPETMEFFNFLYTDKAKEILGKFGYLILE